MELKIPKPLEILIQRYPILVDQITPLTAVLERIIACYRAGDKLLICGNGGSAADAEHIVGELMKGFCKKRPLTDALVQRLRNSDYPERESLISGLQQGLPAIALTGHPALSTAVLNDNDPQMAFAQQVLSLGKPGDVLLGISTSGNSGNVIHALQVGKVLNLATVGLCGANKCRMDDICDHVIHVPEVMTYRIQELHLPIYHALCLGIEDEFFTE